MSRYFCPDTWGMPWVLLPSTQRTAGCLMRRLYSLALISPNSISITWSVSIIQHSHRYVTVLLSCFPRVHTLITLMELEKHPCCLWINRKDILVSFTAHFKLSLRLLLHRAHYIYFGSVFIFFSLNGNAFWHHPYNWKAILPFGV